MAISPKSESQRIRQFADIVRRGVSSVVWGEWIRRIRYALSKIDDSKIRDEAQQRFAQISRYASTPSEDAEGNRDSLANGLEEFADYVSLIATVAEVPGVMTPCLPPKASASVPTEREDAITGEGGIIEIHARTPADAAKQILSYLNQARTDGWTVGNASALIDGWRNEYELVKGSLKSVLAFDMRPTLKHVTNRIGLTMATLLIGAASPSAVEQTLKLMASIPVEDQASAKELENDPEAWIKQRVKVLETTGKHEKLHATVRPFGEMDVVSNRENTVRRVPHESSKFDNDAKQKNTSVEANNIGLHLLKPHGRIGRIRWLVRSFIFSLSIPVLALLISGLAVYPMPVSLRKSSVGLVITACMFYVPLLAYVHLQLMNVVKRLHDFNFSGWWSLIFTPLVYLGGIGLLLLALIPGTRGENRFGPAPRQHNEKGQRIYE